MSRDALVALLLRRCGTVWGHPSTLGPVAASKTESGFRLKRSGMFRQPDLVSMEAKVVDLGGSCRLSGRVGWDHDWRTRRWFYGAIGAAQSALGMALISHGLWVGALNPGWFLVFALVVAAGLVGPISARRVVRHASANRAFLIERLEGMIGVPVVVRAGGARG